MASVSIEHLVRTDRPLTWCSPPSCPRCTLPFTSNTSDEPVHRLAFLLDCQHLLCGQCVQEYTGNMCITCEVCKQPMELRGDGDIVTQALHPSLFMLGVLQQSKYELTNVNNYAQGVEAGFRPPASTASKCTHSERLSTSDINTPKKLLAVLEKAYHTYGRSKKHLENHAQSLQDNVTNAIEQINAHFVACHNALQIEEYRVLGEVRKAYIARCEQGAKDQAHLNLAKNHLEDYLKVARNFVEKKSEKSSGASDSLSWKHFSTEVRQFLEKEPVKLRDDVQKKLRPPINYQPREMFLKGVSSCHSLKIDELWADSPLVPITHKEKKKAAEDEKPSPSLSSSTSSLDKNQHKREKTTPERSRERLSARCKEERHSTYDDSPPRRKHSSSEKDQNDQCKRSEAKVLPDKHTNSSSSSTKKSEQRSSKAKEPKKGLTSWERALDRKLSSSLSANTTMVASVSVASSVVSDHSTGTIRSKSKSVHRRKPQPHDKQEWRTVNVTCVVSPREFYVQDELFATEGAAWMSELCSGDADAYEDRLISGISPLTITPGTMYLVRPDGSKELAWDKKWYRAEVVAVDQPSRGLYRVQYVDYGLYDTVGPDQIRPLSAEMRKAVPQATRCALYELQPAEYTQQWTEECRQVMMDFIGNRPVLMYELSTCRPDQPLLVDLFLAPVPIAPKGKAKDGSDKCDPTRRWDGRYAPMSLRAALIYLGLAEQSQGKCGTEYGDARSSILKKRIERHQRWVQETTNSMLRNNDIPCPPALQEHDQFECAITHVNSIEDFHIMPTKWKKNGLEPLQQLLNNVCRLPATRKLYCPYKGLVCAFARPDGNGAMVWMRGRVLCVLRASCLLLALDTGEQHDTLWSDMRLLAPNDSSFGHHPYVVHCSLGHIRPKRATHGARWTQEAVDEFRQIVCSRTLRFSVAMGRLEPVNDGTYSVVLFMVNKSDRDTCINGLLVRNGHAECFGPADNIQDRVRELPPSEFVHEEEPAGLKLEKSTKEKATASVSTVLRVADPRVPVVMLRIVSPDEFYVLMCSQEAGLEQLHQTIQEHMDDRIDEEEDEEGEENAGNDGTTGNASKKMPGDVCVVFARANEGDPCEWHRARIETVLEDGVHYQAFLIDRAVTTKVHRTNVARLTARMAQIQPGALRCRLACISPVGGSAVWHQSSLDAFRKLIGDYARHAISLDAKPAPDSAERALSVVLWGVRIADRDALAPTRTVHYNLNQALAKVGLAHLSGRFRTFATSGSGAAEEHQLLEHAIGAQLRAEYEQIEQFFRTVAAVQQSAEHGSAGTAGTRGAAAVRDGDKTAEIVLNEQMGEPWLEPTIRSTIVHAANGDGQPVAAWPPAVPLEQSVFVCVPTYVASDGIVYLHNVIQEPVLDRIRAIIAEHVEAHAADQTVASDASASYTVGQTCLARFHVDGQFYRATVAQELTDGRYLVLFVDYGNVEECTGIDLRPATVCGNVPVQAAQVRLSCVIPKREQETYPAVQYKHQTKRRKPYHQHKWPEAALDACHSLIVLKRCTVRVARDGESSSRAVEPTVPYCSLRLLDVDGGGDVDVASVLVQLGLFERENAHRSGKASPCHLPPPVSHAEERQMQFEELMQRSVSSSTGATFSPQPLNAEDQDLKRWIENIQAEAIANQSLHQSVHEDPNEWNEPDDNDEDNTLSPLNRAQLIDALDPTEPDGDTYSGTETMRSVTVDIVESSPMPSPATLNSEEFETSSRLSGDENGPEEWHGEIDQLQDGRISSPLFRSFPVLPLPHSASRGFFAEYANYGRDLTLYIYPHIEGHTRRMIAMAERVQHRAHSTNALHRWQASLLEPGAPCLAPFREDGLYYRAIVETRDEARREVGVLFVDYLNRETVPLAELRKCPIELQRAPLRNIPVRLAGLRTNPRLRDHDVVRRLSDLLEKSFYVRLLERDGSSDHNAAVLPVELYTDPGCHTLVYQEMLDEKYFLRQRPSEDLL